MFAVVKTGGKQYKVQTGDILRIERLAANAGDKVQFNQILMLGGDKTVVGSPLVAGAAVQADVIDQIKGEKTIKFVKRRRKHSSKRTRGHRQYLTLVKVTDILASGADKSKVSEAIGSGSVDFKFVENLKSEKSIIVKSKTEKPSKELVKREAKSAKDAKPEKAKPAKVAKSEKLAKAKKSAPVKEKKVTTSVSDDLKQLSGVGPALEKKLHAAGVKSFEQIAAWSAKDAEAINEKISSKGRVEKEGWIDQAKEKLKE
jgi:large subunit ribosomal protein L21